VTVLRQAGSQRFATANDTNDITVIFEQSFVQAFRREFRARRPYNTGAEGSSPDCGGRIARSNACHNV
jgi:hypothetical protein